MDFEYAVLYKTVLSIIKPLYGWLVNRVYRSMPSAQINDWMCA